MSESLNLNDYSIRRANRSDINALISFGKNEFTRTFGHLYPPSELDSYLDDDYTVEKYLNWISDSSFLLLLSDNKDGVLVGYVLCGPCKLPLENCGHDRNYAQSCGEVKRLYMHPSTFGSGLADKLLTMSLEWLQEVGFGDRVYLGVYSENPRAYRFYCKHGFAKVGEYGFQVGQCVDREFICKWNGTIKAASK